MAQSDRLYFRANDELREQVEAYERKHDFEDRSKATRQLVKVGLREQRHPLVWRLKDRVIDWVATLGIAAIIVFLAGATTTVFTVRDASVFSITLVIVAGVLLGGYELLRLVLGMNEVGEAVQARVSALVGVIR